MSCPNVYETPLSFSPQPVTSLSGSDQSKSQSNPIMDAKVSNSQLKLLRMKERGKHQRNDEQSTKPK